MRAVDAFVGIIVTVPTNMPIGAMENGAKKAKIIVPDLAYWWKMLLLLPLLYSRYF